MYGLPIGVQMLIIEMMTHWKIRLSYGEKKEVGEVRLENGIIQGDAFSHLLFILMIDPLIKILKKSVGDETEVLNSMDDMKASTSSIERHKQSMSPRSDMHSLLELSSTRRAPSSSQSRRPSTSLSRTSKMDETTYKYLGFEMKMA